MLDSIFKSIGTNVINSIVEKTGVTAEVAGKVLPMAQSCLQNGLTEQISSGNTSAITGLFNSGAETMTTNPLFDGIKTNLVSKLTGEMNIPESAAGMVAGTGLTNIVSQITEMTKGEDGTVDENSLMDKLGLGAGLGSVVTGAVTSKLKNLF